VAVMPETVLGLYTEVTAAELADVDAELTARGSAVLVGAGRVHGTGFENGLVVLGEAQRSWISQRIPVPVGMWRPWAPDSVAADPWGSGVVMVTGKRVAILICYEELLVWPALLSMVHEPELIIGAANDWWARDTSIPAIQRQSAALWGRLFGIPVVRAVNT
jgi:apolipoprotein N-acyltransferase